MQVPKLLCLMQGSTGPRTEIWEYSSQTFDMVQCLHQSNVYTKRKLGLWKRAKNCTPLVGAKNALACVGLQTTLSHVRLYRAENGNFGKLWPTFRHGAVFAPKQCLYQNEARAMESPKMYSSSRCKKSTYLCGSPNNSVSCKAVQGRERKVGETRTYLPPRCSLCTKAMFISKGS